LFWLDVVPTLLPILDCLWCHTCFERDIDVVGIHVKSDFWIQIVVELDAQVCFLSFLRSADNTATYDGFLVIGKYLVSECIAYVLAD
jgi:hypothetical protein